MNFIYNLAEFLALISILLFFLSFFIRNKLRARHISLKKALLACIVLFFIFIIIGGILDPNKEKLVSVTKATATKVVTHAKTAERIGIKTKQPTTTPSPTKTIQEDKPKISMLLQQNIDSLKQVFNDGQNALGSTQYQDAYAGMQALNDPTSQASIFSQFKQKENPATHDYYSSTMKQVNPLIEIDSTQNNVGQWSDDQGTLTSDISKWITDATGWQISTVPTSTLNTDENKINQDLVLLGKDIQAIQ